MENYITVTIGATVNGAMRYNRKNGRGLVLFPTDSPIGEYVYDFGKGIYFANNS